MSEELIPNAILVGQVSKLITSYVNVDDYSYEAGDYPIWGDQKSSTIVHSTPSNYDQLITRLYLQTAIHAVLRELWARLLQMLSQGFPLGTG